jgi:hypothetical protein
MQPWKLVNLTNVVPKSKQYKYLTGEVSRLDLHHIPKSLAQFGLVFGKKIGLDGGPYMRTHSMKTRLRNYINKKSRNGKYIEVLPIEVDELNHLPALMAHDDLRLVEVGFNRQEDICKVAYTTKLKSSGRTVFLCIGADAGLKTFYVTPTFKYRSAYQYSDRQYKNKAVGNANT